jgi:hypothetical protein
VRQEKKGRASFSAVPPLATDDWLIKKEVAFSAPTRLDASGQKRLHSEEFFFTPIGCSGKWPESEGDETPGGAAERVAVMLHLKISSSFQNL